MKFYFGKNILLNQEKKTKFILCLAKTQKMKVVNRFLTLSINTYTHNTILLYSDKESTFFFHTELMFCYVSFSVYMCHILFLNLHEI